DESVRRVVFASSSSVYGNSDELPRVETQNPDPISPYGVSKLAAERYCVSFSRVYPLETVALRYFNVFGPNQDPSSQYAAVVARLNMGGPALHVAYLTGGLRDRGYDTTLVAGTLARGEDSMAFVAEELGVEVLRIEELGREISPLRDLLATVRLARVIRRTR